jgi:hypothetical protein
MLATIKSCAVALPWNLVVITGLHSIACGVFQYLHMRMLLKHYRFPPTYHLTRGFRDMGIGFVNPYYHCFVWL